MRQASRAFVVAAIAVAAAACTRVEPPIESYGQFDGELGAAKQKRRVMALASPT